MSTRPAAACSRRRIASAINITTTKGAETSSAAPDPLILCHLRDYVFGDTASDKADPVILIKLKKDLTVAPIDQCCRA
jgi:hypothetical protein